MIRSRYDYEGYVAAARSRLGQEAFEAAWAEGRTMTPEEAIDYALLAPETPAQAGPHRTFPLGSAPARPKS